MLSVYCCLKHGGEGGCGRKASALESWRYLSDSASLYRSESYLRRGPASPCLPNAGYEVVEKDGGAT